MAESCFMIVNNSISGLSTVYLPCYPDEVSDSVSSNWSDQSILGMSSPISSYTGTGYRSVSFSFTLHREMASTFDVVSNGNNENIENILRVIRGCVYPEYGEAGVTPTLVTFVFGNFRAHGIVRSVSYAWKKPIIDGNYQVADVQVQMDDVPDSIIGTSSLGSALNPFNHK